MQSPGSFQCGSTHIGTGELTLIAGPCLAESADLCLQVAESVLNAATRLGISAIFKASFDKANRTSGDSVRGVGIDEGLRRLEIVKQTFHMPVTTDIHLPEQAALVAPLVDIIQIPAFLCRQTDLLAAAAETKRPVNVKKGQFLAPWDTLNIVKKLQSFSARGIMLTERGNMFGYQDLVVDYRGIPEMQSLGIPVIMDCTHSLQQPNQPGSDRAGVCGCGICAH